MELRGLNDNISFALHKFFIVDVHEKGILAQMTSLREKLERKRITDFM